MSKTKATPGAVCEVDHLRKPRVRDRILGTAGELFYRHGIRAVGIDAITSEAGTNKMSFYRNFPSKDELVAEYLRDQERDGWAWWDEVVSAHQGDPRAQVDALFQAQLKRMCVCESRGCALANAATEITADSPARTVVEQYNHEMRRRFRQLARDMRARKPDVLGDALMLLWEGSYLTRLIFPGREGPVQSAAHAARTLIDAHVTSA